MKLPWVISLLYATAFSGILASAQTPPEDGQLIYRMPKDGNYLRYRVERGDTVYFDTIKPAYKTARGNRKNRWRRYSRLVHNFAKTYPYALEGKRLIALADSTIAADGLKRRKKDKYVNIIQKELLQAYEPVVRDMTVSQGKLLVKLIGRETGLTPYEIVKDYKNGMAAGFWQGLAKVFGGDLKKHYDPSGEDAPIEELVRIWDAGEFPALYVSVFGKVPPEVPILSSETGKDTGAVKKSRKKKKK